MNAVFDWLSRANDSLFLLINAPARPDAAVLAVAQFSASGLMILVALAAATIWLFGRRSWRRAILVAGSTVALGLAVNWTIAALWYHPRPFVVGLGHAFATHSPETSFPSDHATFLWSLGFALLLVPAARAFGWVVVLLGVVTAWARVYVGLHFPMDMAGSFLISLASAATMRRLTPVLDRHLLPVVERLHAGLATLVRMGSRR